MLVGERGHTDTEVTVRADHPDEVGGVLDALGVLDPVPHRVTGRVAAHGEDVADADRGEPSDQLPQFGLRVVDGGEVRDRRERRVGGDPLNDVDGLVTGAAARAVGHRHKRRAQGLQLADRPPQVPRALVGFGREELEREGPARGQQLSDGRGPVGAQTSHHPRLQKRRRPRSE